MKKVFERQYASDLTEDIKEWLLEKLPPYTGNGEFVIVEIIKPEENK